MKVILLKDVKGSGKAGDIIEAKDGFAQNYLIKNGYAKIADAAAIKQNKELCEKLNGTEITLQVKSGAAGKFFGSVTNKEIADKLAELGFEVDKKKIILQSNIKTAGTYPVTVKISPEETARITVNIIN